MPNIKIVFHELYDPSPITASDSGWQYVSDEDLEFLRDNLRYLNNLFNPPCYRVSIIIEDNVPIADRINQIKIAKQQEEQLKNQTEAEKKAAAERRKEAREKKTIEELRAKLEKLEAKHDNPTKEE